MVWRMDHSRGEFVTGTGALTVSILDVTVSSAAWLLDTLRFVPAAADPGLAKHQH